MAVGVISMRLEVASFPVQDVQFSDHTHLKNGVLWVDRDELRDSLLAGNEFADVRVEVVRPGERRRVIHVIDAVEPRLRAGSAADFPGWVDGPATVGHGRTHRLAGMSIVSAGDAVAGEATYWREGLIDMSGPGAAVTPFGALVNLILEFEPLPEQITGRGDEALGEDSIGGSALADRYNRSVRVAELKAAVYLARATNGLAPASVTTYEQTPVRASLPRVVYLYQNGSAVYGHSFQSSLPTLIHANEILDGALIPSRSNWHASTRDSTFLMQNHATINELYAHHGMDLDFVGVVIFPSASDDVEQKERMTDYVVKLAQLLRADGAIVCGIGGGHPIVDFMLLVQKCERAGIKTVQVMPESYGTPEDPGFVHFLPEATRIVSTGRSTEVIDLPAAADVIGGTKLFDVPDDPRGELQIPYRYLYGATTVTGYGRLMAQTV